MSVISKSTRILTPSFPIERVFHERQLRASIADKVARLEAMRVQMAAMTEKRVEIEHCLVGDEEMLLVSLAGDDGGVAVSMDDLHNGRITLQQVCESVM